MLDLSEITQKSQQLAEDAAALTERTKMLETQLAHSAGLDPFLMSLTIFVLACFVGYYVVWRVTPALHTPLMSVTNAVSGIIVVGAIIALGAGTGGLGQIVGFFAVMLASINIFGGFVVTQRMLDMYKKKEGK